MSMSYVHQLPRRRYARKQLTVPALWRQVVGATMKGDDRGVPGEFHGQPDRSAYTQLEIYDGLLAAFDRRSEVLEALARAADRDAAIRTVRDLLGVSRVQAVAVIELQLHRFTTESRDRIALRAAELRAALTR